MSNIKINDVPQRIQYLASNGQTQFSIPFPFFQNSYVIVWQDGVQLFPGGAPGQYAISGAGSPSGGLITLVTPAALNSVITIEGQMPIDRTSIYSATISNLTGSDLNGDFNREVVMLQQLNTTQEFLQLQYAPWALVSQDLTNTRDRYIPILPPLGAWRMNAGGTAIETFQTPSSGGLAPDDGQYLVQTADVDLPDAVALDTFASGIMVNQLGVGFIGTRILSPVANQTVVTNGNGVSGNPAVGIADNPTIPGTAGMGIPVGSTAQRVIPTPPSIGLRYNTDFLQLEYYDLASGGIWQQLEESNDIAGLIARLAANTVGDGASMIGLQNQTGVTNKTVQDLANAGIIAKTDNGTLTNGQFLSALASGALGVTTTTGVLLSRVHTGTANQIDVTNGDLQGGNPTYSLPATLIAPGTFQVGNLLLSGNTIASTDTNGNVDIVPNGLGFFQVNSTQGIDEIMNDSTLATATANNLASALALKTYIDSKTSGLQFVSAVVAATTPTDVYTVTYNNGASGVGATLTNAGVQAAFSVDSYTPTVGQRVLIKDQASTSQNGIYTVTVVGDAITNWVLTRATDYDQPAEILPGQIVPVLIAGALNGGTSWLQTNTVATIGTDPIQFIQYTVRYPVSLDNGGTGANLAPTASLGGIVYSTATELAILAGTATANLPLLSGSTAAPTWGAYALNLGGALTTAGAHTLSGAFASTFTFTNTTNVTFPTSGTLATTAQLPTGAALTKTDDTNVTLTLGGSPSTALLFATSLTLGWTGTLAVDRGGSGRGTATAYAVICGGTTSTGAHQSVASVGTSGQVLTSNGAGAMPTFQNSATNPGGSTTQLQYNNAGAFGGDSGSTTDGAGGLTIASLNFTNFATGGLKGTTTNNSAATGYVGEFVSSTVNQGSGVSLSNATAANITSISLTAGDWDVWGNFNVTATGATTLFFGWTSNTSASIPNAALYTSVAGSSGGQGIGMPVPYRRVSISGTTTVYLSCQANFTTGTAAGSGGIFARRAR